HSATKHSLSSFLTIVGVLAVLTFGPIATGSVGSPAPELSNKTWINSQPLHLAELKGKVVMVEFWTFGCYNCRNVEPYIKQWHSKYSDQGLVIIGVHSPEFSHEANVDKVRDYVRKNGIEYAVAIDNDFATWKRYDNHYWPARYMIDKQGVLRNVYIGEGDYAQNEKEIQALLAER
ncbi:MAG: redoxin domain-containing protein, partial [Gammaproteobacteria bacterium]